MQEIGGSAFFLLTKGFARIEQFDSSDQFSYMDYIKKGALFPYGGMFQDERYHYTASAVTDLRCFVIPVNLYELYAQERVRSSCSLLRKALFHPRISRVAFAQCRDS